jgi:hypothetical protein
VELYLVIFLLTAVLVPSDRMRATQGARLALLAIPFALLLFMAGLRYETGNDWQPYFEYYTDLQNLSDNAENFEIGYRAFAWICKSAGMGYSGFIFVSTLLYMSTFFMSFRNQRGAVTLVLLFYCTYLLGWMGTARQVIALGLTVCAGEALLEGRRVGFFLLVLIASTFHQTALLFLLAWFMRAPTISTRSYIVITIACIVAGQLLETSLPVVIDLLTGTQGVGRMIVFYGKVGTDELNQAGGPLLGVLWYVKRLVFFGVFLILRDRLDSPRLKFYFNAYFFSVAFFLVLNPTLPILATRGANYFSIYELYLLAALVVARGRLAALALPLIVCLAGQRLYTALYAYHPDLYIPYKGLLINDDYHREIY